MKRNTIEFTLFLNFILISVILIKNACYGFYLHKNGKYLLLRPPLFRYISLLNILDFNENDHQKFIDGYKIVYDKLDHTSEFPDEFYLHFKNFEKNFKLKFLKKRSVDHHASVYTVEDGKVIEHKFETGDFLVNKKILLKLTKSI